MLKSSTYEAVETELVHGRKLASILNDSLLCYLIDMAILHAKKQSLVSENTWSLEQTPIKLYQSQAAK